MYAGAQKKTTLWKALVPEKKLAPALTDLQKKTTMIKACTLQPKKENTVKGTRARKEASSCTYLSTKIANSDQSVHIGAQQRKHWKVLGPEKRQQQKHSDKG